MAAFKKVVNKLVGELLIDSGVITRTQLNQALSRKKETGKLLGETLVELGFASEDDVASVVATQYRIPYLPLKNHDVDKELIKTIPLDLVMRHRFFPVDKISTVLTVAMENPLDEKAVGEIQQLTGSRVLCYVSTPSEILAAIEQHYGGGEPGAARSTPPPPKPPPKPSPSPPESRTPAPPPEPAMKETNGEGGIKVFQLEEDVTSEE